MSDSTAVAAHYARRDLLAAIEAGVRRLGKTPETVTIADLAPVDEFHVGGRQASTDLLDQLNLTADHHLLDVGCGLGGAARLAATHYGCRVTGVDLTPDYVAVGNELCRWVNLHDRVTLQQSSALAIPTGDAQFDGGYLLHVGMNIADKAALAAELYRVLKPGATFGIYDLMRMDDTELPYPMPWATTTAMSWIASPQVYKAALQAAGFTLVTERNRLAFAQAFFRAGQAGRDPAAPPPALGLHLLMAESGAPKLRNMIGQLQAGTMAPVELIVRKPGIVAS
jgi:ubiquinone/menaquinone biosynthesis C-methylase UbiE